MYAYLKGIIEEKNGNICVVDINGVGYELLVSTNSLEQLPPVGEIATIYTYLHVREDAYLLFGFATKQEKEVFLKLISVSGVGAKTAIAILSGITPQNLISCVMMSDIKTIGAIKGIGKKTAERIVVELKASLGALQGIANIPLMDYMNQVATAATDEAIEVLVNMGLSKVDALRIVTLVAGRDDTTEEIIEKALRNMG